MTAINTFPIQLNNISKSFASDVILSDITFNFFAGKTTAIIGKSGCGKSTLLKLINGLERPDTGSISIFNSPIDYQKIEQLRHKIGYSVQGTGLFPHLTVRQNVSLVAEVNGWSKVDIDQRLKQLAELMSLDLSLLSRYPHELSGGQQQRAGLSRAMMLDPDVLLFDEAFAAVDPLTRYDIHQQILQLQQACPRTILLVTHDLQEAFRLADRIVIVHNQKIVSHEAKEYFLKNDDSGQKSIHQSTDNPFLGYNLDFNESILKWLS